MKNPLFVASMNYGGFFGLLLIILSVLIYVTGMEQGGTISNVLTWSSIIGGQAFFMLKFRNEANNGYASYGQVFLAGILIIVFAAILQSFYSWVFFEFIDPDMIDVIKQKSYEDMLAKGNSEEQAIKQMEYAEPFMTSGSMSVMWFFMLSFFGVIFSAIISIFVKRENPNPFSETE